MRRSLLFILALGPIGFALAGPVTEPKKADSVRQFVSQFYEWYVPKAIVDHDGPSSDLALKFRSSVFDSKLLKALRRDAAAQAKVKGEIVGLDFDPFLASQDPVSRYVVGKVEAKGASYWAGIHPVTEGKRSLKPVVLVEVKKENGAWKFTDFRYLDGSDLLSVLRELKRDRDKL